MEIKQSEINSLIDDVAYLEHETEALKYVIDSVPYDESPKKGRSISEILLFLDHSQQSYYRKIVEDAVQNMRPINLNTYPEPSTTFEKNEELTANIQKLLYKLSKHRVAFINFIKGIQLIDWEREVKQGRESITLYEFVNQMVRKERKALKEIANLVQNYQQRNQAEDERESPKPEAS